MRESSDAYKSSPVCMLWNSVFADASLAFDVGFAAKIKKGNCAIYLTH